MTRYTLQDHNRALQACFDATKCGAVITDSDLVILNRVAGSYACNVPENLAYHEFENALSRVSVSVEKRLSACSVIE